VLVLVKFVESKVRLTREYCKYDTGRAECDFVPWVYGPAYVLVLLVFYFILLRTEYLRGGEGGDKFGLRQICQMQPPSSVHSPCKNMLTYRLEDLCVLICVCVCVCVCVCIHGVTGGRDKTSGGCSLC
jgi:hypothetical protein